MGKKSKKVINSVEGNNIEVTNQVIWDSASVEVMGKVARGLLNMTELFKKQGVVLESMIKIEGSSVNVTGCTLTNNESENLTTGINFKS